MINLRDARILFQAIANMRGSYICNTDDGDMVRKIDIFNLLNTLFEDGIEIKAERDENGKVTSYDMYWKDKSLENQNEMPIL